MADFDIAYKITKPFEGGYSNDPLDSGKRTYIGISEVHNPNWSGWDIVDKHEPMKYNEYIISGALDSLAREIYLTRYWNKIRLSEVKDQRVANQIFDWFVNSGGNAIKRIQKILGVTTDGIVGVKTIEAINRGGVHLNDLIRDSRIDYYNDIVAARPTQAKFLKGWLSRANSF